MKVIDLTNLYNLFSDSDTISFEDMPNEYFMGQYQKYIDLINGIYSDWFPNSKPVTSNDIINQSFSQKEKKDAKNKIKYSVACLIQSSERIYHSSQKFYTKKKFEYYKAEKKFLKEVAFEASIFIYESALLHE